MDVGLVQVGNCVRMSEVGESTTGRGKTAR